MTEFAENILKTIELKGLTLTDVAKSLNKSRTTLYTWLDDPDKHDLIISGINEALQEKKRIYENVQIDKNKGIAQQGFNAKKIYNNNNGNQDKVMELLEKYTSCLEDNIALKSKIEVLEKELKECREKK